MKPIKIITSLLFCFALLSILIGYLIDFSFSQQLIGFGVLGLFFVVFPLFSYDRWKDKDMKDYMLTQDNLDKMREAQNHNENSN